MMLFHQKSSYTNLKKECNRYLGRGAVTFALTNNSCVAKIIEIGITNKGRRFSEAFPYLFHLIPSSKPRQLGGVKGEGFLSLPFSF
jgi:hypothetical protein